MPVFSWFPYSRCLVSILADFLNPDIVHDPKYKFSQSGVYYAPPKSKYEEYVEFIKVGSDGLTEKHFHNIKHFGAHWSWLTWNYTCFSLHINTESWSFCEMTQAFIKLFPLIFLSYFSFLIYTIVLYLQLLPLSQTPEVFGMHDNVDISKELQETRQLFDSVLLTQSQGGGGGTSKKTEETLLEIAKDILSKVRLPLG